MTPTPSAAPGGDLVRLLEAEERLEALLARAGAEAARIVASAREASAAREQELEAEVAEIEHRLEAEAGAERSRRIQEIEDAARREIESLDSMAGERIAALARHVAARVIGEGLE